MIKLLEAGTKGIPRGYQGGHGRRLLSAVHKKNGWNMVEWLAGLNLTCPLLRYLSTTYPHVIIQILYAIEGAMFIHFPFPKWLAAAIEKCWTMLDACSD